MYPYLHTGKVKSCLLLLAFSLLWSCQPTDAPPQKPKPTSNQPLFSLLSTAETGIDFANMLEEKLERNIGLYEYYYNGGGVAIGDVNKDGLEDIFFTGNLLPNRLYLNEGNLKFKDVSKTAGIQSNRWSTGATMVDINKDGWLDIYVCNSGPYKELEIRTNQLYINQKDGTFSEEAEAYGIADQSKSTQASFFDYDKDGDLDLFVMNHSWFIHETSLSIEDRIKDLSPADYRRQSCSLYRNDGSGKFTDITESSGILKLAFGLGLVTSDLNQDGWIDIYVANDFFIPDFMYINNGDGTFTDRIKEKVGHSPYYSMGCDAADINNDGLVDLANLDMTPDDHVRSKMLMASMDVSEFRYLTGNKNYLSQYMLNTLQVNNGFGIFSEIGLLAGVSKTDWSWAALLADFDNDGFKDYFITNGFKRDTKNNDWKAKIMAIRAENNGDIANEDYWRLLQETDSNPIENYIFRNNGQFHFDIKNEEWGLQQKTFSNGAAYADLDQDGDLEIIVNNIDQRAFIYRNNAQENYIRFELMNSQNVDAALHAKVHIYYGEQEQFVEYSPVRGFQASVEPYIHFGLGQSTVIDRVVIKWLNGTETTIQQPAINQTHQVDQAKVQNRPIASPKLKPRFFDITKQQEGIAFTHEENEYDDFAKEILLPHMQSTLGPHVSVGDANGDQIEDFFIGGAKGQAGVLYLQQANGKFYAAPNQAWAADKGCEDMGSLFFDVDGDGDQDLYIASGGGGEFSVESAQLQDRLYLNDGKGNFRKAANALPKMRISTGRVKAADYDGDGDLDLFVGGRTLPGRYPFPVDSYLLQNNGGKFTDITDSKASELRQLGMVTDAVWTDVDRNGQIDLVVVGEWMPISIFINQNGQLKNQTSSYGLENTQGWWYSLAKADFDKDGYEDLVIGNLGQNNKFRPKAKKPLHIYCNDFDENGSLDIVLSKDYKNNLVPVRGKECSTEQMPFLAKKLHYQPFLAKKFPTFKSFSESSLTEIYGEEKLDKALHYQVRSAVDSLRC